MATTTPDTGEEVDSSDAPEDDDDGDSVTANTSFRHPYTNDILAGWLIITFTLVFFFDALGWIALGSPTRMAVGYLTFVGIAVVWTFGAEALSAWRK